MRIITTENWGRCCCSDGDCIAVGRISAVMQFEGHFTLSELNGQFFSIIGNRYDYDWTGQYMQGTYGGIRVAFYDTNDVLIYQFEHNFTSETDSLLTFPFTSSDTEVPDTADVKSFDIDLSLLSKKKLCAGHKKWKFNGVTLRLTEGGSKFADNPMTYDFKYQPPNSINGSDYWTPIE